MRVKYRKWDMLLACHKKLLDMIGEEKLDDLLPALHRTAMYLTLSYSDFKCQDCGKGSDLSIQHMIKNTDKKFFDHVRFFRARCNWENIIALCAGCHIAADKLNNTPEQFLTIPPEKLNQIKRYFESNSHGSPNVDIPLEIAKDLELPKETTKKQQTEKKTKIKPKLRIYWEDPPRIESY